MASSRMIRAGFVDSDKVNSLSWFAECLYHRLLLVADDYGLYDARPMFLRSQLFGMKLEAVREADLQRALADVESAGLVRFYAVDGKPYLWLVNYGQRVQSGSRYPLPNDEEFMAAYAKSAVAHNSHGNSPRSKVNKGDSRCSTVNHRLDGDVDVDGDVDEKKGSPSGEPKEAAGRDLVEQAMQPDRERAQKGRGARPKSADEVKAYLAQISTILHFLNPAERDKAAQAFFDEMESVDWVNLKGQNIWNWQAYARRFATKWADNLNSPFRNGQPATGSMMSLNKGTFNDRDHSDYDKI